MVELTAGLRYYSSHSIRPIEPVNVQFGFYKPMEQFLNEFRDIVETARSNLLVLGAEEAAKGPAGKWSAKEIVGHLIDSAANNHQRFVRAQFNDDLVCPPYDQESWVNAQKYAEASWPDLVNLWASYNLHLHHVISVMPHDALSRLRERHNLDQVAWNPVDRATPTTLEYFVRDYVGHMRHHLRQILGQEFGNSYQIVN
jgi:hypothetical protein